MIVLSGARIFDGENFLLEHAVVVEGERIAAIVPYAERPQGAARDLAGGLLAPGYIDVQVNGGGGVPFNEDPTPEALARVAPPHRHPGSQTRDRRPATDARDRCAAGDDRRHRRDARGAASDPCDTRPPSGRALLRPAPQGRARTQIYPRPCTRRRRDNRRRGLRR